MREIKFRFYDAIMESMLSMKEFQATGMSLFVALEGVNIIKVMQYTGLKDKNDVEIYEGDIVATGFQNDTKGTVKYDEGMFYVFCSDSNMYFNHTDRYEVIGNIFEKPELLEESK